MIYIVIVILIIEIQVILLNRSLRMTDKILNLLVKEKLSSLIGSVKKDIEQLLGNNKKQNGRKNKKRSSNKN